MQAINLPDFVSQLYHASESKIRRYACHVNRASGLGDDCERRLTYDRTAWEQKELHDVHLQRIFDEGNLHERALLRELADAGIEVIQQQDDLRLEHQNITGHVDGVIVVGSKAVPLEIKSMSEHIWNAIAFRGPGVYEWTAVHEKFQAKPWTRKYCAQLQIYMLAKNTDAAILLLKNKQTGGLAQINMDLDYDYAESLLQRAERINAHVAADTLPDRIAYDPDVCSRCPYFHICLPDYQAGPPIKFVAEEQIRLQCDIRAEMEPAHHEYSRADKTVKDWAKAQDADRMVVAGSYLIERRTAGGRTMVTIQQMEAL